MNNKTTCGECGQHIEYCLYWFDSLYFANWNERKVIPFCGPPCVQKWHTKNNVKDWPARKPPYPKGEQWEKIVKL